MPHKSITALPCSPVERDRIGVVIVVKLVERSVSRARPWCKCGPAHDEQVPACQHSRQADMGPVRGRGHASSNTGRASANLSQFA